MKHPTHSRNFRPRTAWFFASTAALALLSGCSPSKFDAASESARLLAVDAEWSAAAYAGKDVAKIISYWTDDAIIYPPGQPMISTKDGQRQFVESMLKIPGFKISWKSYDPVFFEAGRLATMRGENEAIVPGPDGKPMTVHGRGITLWRKEADGRWRCTCDIWNDAPTAR